MQPCKQSKLGDKLQARQTRCLYPMISLSTAAKHVHASVTKRRANVLGHVTTTCTVRLSPSSLHRQQPGDMRSKSERQPKERDGRSLLLGWSASHDMSTNIASVPPPLVFAVHRGSTLQGSLIRHTSCLFRTPSAVLAQNPFGTDPLYLYKYNQFRLDSRTLN